MTDSLLLGSIQSDLLFIAKSDFTQQFRIHSDIIRNTDYQIKFAYEPFPNSLTTWGSRYVRIPRSYLRLDQIERCGLLIHEAQHCIQYDKSGSWIKFIINYLCSISKYENDAKAWQNKWLAKFGRKVL